MLKIESYGLTITGETLDDLRALLALAEEFPALLPAADCTQSGETEETSGAGFTPSLQSNEETELRAEWEAAGNPRFSTRGKCERGGALQWLREWKAGRAPQSEESGQGEAPSAEETGNGEKPVQSIY